MNPGVDVYAARTDGWHDLRGGGTIGTDPDPPQDLTGYFMVSAAGPSAQGTIQNALDNHGKVGLTDVALGGAANYDCVSSILMESNYELYVGNGVNLWRNFNSGNATSTGFIKNRSWNNPVNDAKLWGPGNIAARNGMGGNILSLWANRLWSSGWKTTYYKRHTMIAGDDIVMQDHNWRVEPGIQSGGAGLRFAGGHRFLGQRLNIVSGDDVFQIVPAGATNDPLWNISETTDTVYRDCQGMSYSGRVIAVGLQDSNNGANVSLGMNTSILDSLFQRIYGYGGGSAVNIANHSSVGTIQRQYFDEVHIDQRKAGQFTVPLDPNHGQPGETYVQRENAGCGIVDDIDYAGATGHGSGVFIYNKRAAKDMTYISQPFGGVTDVTTAQAHAGSLSVVLP